MENDKTYLLNIQQQVRKNQIEIELLKSGIKIVGAGETLPASANEGDCYLLGTEGDYELNAYVNGNWIPLGSFPAVGPQGVPGVKGDPAVISYITCAARAIDYGLAPSVSASVNGETVSFDFELPGGPRGFQGPKGEKGDKGDQGNVGPQGPQGEPGNSIRLFQNPSVVTASDLPAASVVGAGVGYLVGTYGTGYELYVTANDPLEWVDAGPFIPTQVTVDPKLDRLSENAVENKPVAKAIGISATFATVDDVEQGLDFSDDFDAIWSNGYPFSAVDGGTRYKYLSFKEVIGSGGTYNRTYDYITFSHNADGLGVSFAKVTTNSVGLTDSATVDSAGTFVVPKRSELVTAKNSLNAEIARSKAADELHQKEITLLKNLVYDTVAASFSYSDDYVYWMDIPASVEVSGSYHEVLDDAAAQIEEIEGTSVVWNQLVEAMVRTGNTLPANDFDNICLPKTGAYGRKLVACKITTANESDLYIKIICRDSGGSYDEKNMTISNGFACGVYGFADIDADGIIVRAVNRGNDAIAYSNASVAIVNLSQAFPSETPTTLDDPRIQAILSNPDMGYDAGSIKSSTVDEVISHGFNLWDEEWESGYIDPDTGEKASDGHSRIRSKNFIRLSPNTTYYFKTPAGFNTKRLYFYDANHNYIGYNETDGAGTFTTPNGCLYMMFWVGLATYNHDICINKSNVSLNGNYKPWVAPMSVDLEALGVALSNRTLMSAGTVRDRIYAAMQPDETYQLRRTGKLDKINLGTQTWVAEGQDASGLYRFASSGIVSTVKIGTLNYICGSYPCATDGNHTAGVSELIIHPVTGYITVWIAANDASQIKGSLVFELDTPDDELLAEGLTFGDLELLIEKGGYLSIDGDGDSYGAIPGLMVDLPILRYE